MNGQTSIEDFIGRAPVWNAAHASRGFSLIELLTVITIIAILTSLGAVAFSNIASGRNVAISGNIIMDQMALAQQTATAKNARVRWQILSVPDTRNGDPAAFRLTRLQIFVPKSRAWLDIAPAKLLPLSVQAVTNLSTLLTNEIVSVTDLTYDGRTGSNTPARSIVFFGDGLTDLNPNDRSSLTLRDVRNTNNFLTLQIDPVSGRLRTFQQ